MANSYLVDINVNDPLPDVVRKANQNFRIITSAQQAYSQTSIRRSEDSMANTVIDGAVAELAETLNAAKAELDRAVEEAQKKVDEMTEQLLSPLPVGTYLGCTYDPNIQWPGTTWVSAGTIGSGITMWNRTA